MIHSVSRNFRLKNPDIRVVNNSHTDRWDRISFDTPFWQLTAFDTFNVWVIGLQTGDFGR